MNEKAAQNPSHTTAQPIDWIVLSANALGVIIVALAALYAKADGIVHQVASSAGTGAIF